MEILIDNKYIKLQKKDRKLNTEAPAMRINMQNGETKVIGMMADKVQVIITINNNNDLNTLLIDIIKKYQKANIYLISSSDLNSDIDKSMCSNDFKDVTLKLGVYIDDSLCAKSIFIINKDGEFTYKQIVPNLQDNFNLNEFDKALNEAISFKKKGHTHENWMTV